MATALQTFRFTARSCSCRGVAHRYATRPIGKRRTFSTTPFRRQDNEEEKATKVAQVEQKANAHPGAGYRRRLESDMQGIPESMLELDNIMAASIARHSQPPEEVVDRKPAKIKDTFLNMGETEAIELDEDEDPGEDIPTLAHGELEAHREKRHYARLAAWEMPLLSKMAKPFVPPTADMPLRFRYTTYMGEQHPAEKKVSLEFCTADMPDLTKVQRAKLKKLVGARYNPETDIVKMSCEMFESQAQNKRYLGDRVDELLIEARDPTDTFEDIPLDVRHHTFKSKPKFPSSWRLTPARIAELAQYREEVATKDQTRMLAGKLIDGVRQIESAWSRIPVVEKEALSDMVMAGRGGKGQKGKKIAIRR